MVSASSGTQAERRLAGTLADPTPTLFDGAGRILDANDDWNFPPQAEQIRKLAAASGAFTLPADSFDSSLTKNFSVPPCWADMRFRMRA